jgi:hypothetical protein
VGAGQVARLGLRSRRDHALIWVGHELRDLVWYLFVAACLVSGRSRLSDTVYQLIADTTAYPCAGWKRWQPAADRRRV